MEQNTCAALVLDVGLHLETVDLADILDGEIQGHLLAALHEAIAVAVDVVRHLEAVCEPRFG